MSKCGHSGLKIFRVGLVGYRQTPVALTETTVGAHSLKEAERNALTKAASLSPGSGIIWEAVGLGVATKQGRRR